MATTPYRCKNFGGCNKAIERETIQIEDGDDPICPECKEPLEPLKGKKPEKRPGESGPDLPKWLVPGVAVVLLTAITIGIHLHHKRVAPLNQSNGTTPPRSTPSTRLIETTSCADSVMADAIRKRIALEDDLRDDHILVDVANHAVFLSGTVSSNSDRTRAQDLVQFASCRVASIVNDLSSAPSDQAIDLEARRRLAADHEFQHQPIRVGVSSGVIVLSGSVSEHPMRSNAGTLMAGIPGLHNVINNLDVVAPPPQPPNVRGYGAGTHLPLKPPLSNNLTGSWTGTYMSCSQATTPASATIQDSGVDDITASLRIEIPGAIPGSLTMHGVLAPLNGHLTLTFNGWEHQPPGVSMGNVGGYVSFTPAGATSFTGTIFGPGCGTLTLHRR